MARSAPASPLSPRRFLLDLIVTLGVVLLAGWVTTRWVAVPFVVEGPSMEPALEEGDRVIVLLGRLASREPASGDVVLIDGPGGEPLVKRIAPAGAPGAAGIGPMIPPESPLEPTYIVLGDNAAWSSDSRAFGPVPLHRIRGRVVWRYWPLSRLGRIEYSAGSPPPAR